MERLEASHYDDVWEVTGVAGRTVDLPCYLRPRTPGDRPKLVLWYKESHSSPLVSHDTRDGVPLGDSGLDLNVGLGRGKGEGALRVGRGSATLTYLNVTPQHAGLYECRVDFYTSPAHTNYVNLTVVELPRSVRLLDKESASLQEGVLGPYYTGQTVRVACVALGGRPRPKLTWWRNNHILRTGGEEEAGAGRVRSELVIESIGRGWHNHTLTCTASSTPLASPLPASAIVTLYLLPRVVEVRTPGRAREGHPALIICTTEGSRPPPTLTLKLGGRRLIPDKEKMEGLVSVATVAVNVTRADHGAVVSCKAENPAVPGSALRNTTTLSVEYPPSVTASLGRSLKPHLLKEGDDVYFTCSVDANPPAASVTWYHEGRVQVQNMTSGVILTGDSLVLQRVSRRRAGEYRCEATNSLASVTSSPVRLKIRYRPQCLTTPTTYFIYDQPINVSCTVTSHPPATDVHWQWNSSNDVIKTQKVEAKTERVSTQLSVAPIETYEDRLLSCWAVNEMGRQQRACGFSIKVAEMPLPLSSCGLANITASSLSLTCQRPPLASPGSSTLYRAEVYLENRTLLANVTSASPNFNVSRLDAGTSYQIKVYVSHGPVTSPPVVVSAYTSRTPPDKSNEDEEEHFVEMRGDLSGGIEGGGDAETGLMETAAAGDGSEGVGEGGKDQRGGRRGRLGGGDGKTEMGAVMAAAVAVAVLATMGGVWAWRRRWRWQGGGSTSATARGTAGARTGGKDPCQASSSSSGNPDVVPNLGSSYNKRSASPRLFWNKDKTVEASGGATGRLPALEETPSLADTTAGGSGAADSSPSESQRISGVGSTSTPTLSQKTVCSGGNSSPAESSRAAGGGSSSSLTSSVKTVCSVGTSTPTDGLKSRDSTSSPSQSPAAGGRGSGGGNDGCGGNGSSSSNSSRRAAVIAYRPAPSGGSCRRGGAGRGGAQRPISAVGDLGVSSLRKSFLLSGEEAEEDYLGQASPEERLRRRKSSLAEEESSERRRRRRATGVRFSFTPGEVEEEEELGVAYHGAKGSYLLRELKGYPGTLPRRAPRDVAPPPRGHFGSREVLDLHDSDPSLGEFVPYPAPLYGSREALGGTGVRRALREDSYAEFLPHGAREAPGRAGVRVQLSGRAHLLRGSRHSLGLGASVGELRAAGAIQRRGSWASLHYPVDQLIKAAETVV
ncbi:hemicentin-1-like isoform X2 [Eriocheir sinensis]|uniref:hemicentin-1-like isoform X2 n=1 Tax=Eriocheir sinensis TaxID=95602 RepID=UPI0021C844DD|nr:hemicentin-1-like isoform X2 [Eriocheir sinensis]